MKVLKLEIEDVLVQILPEVLVRPIEYRTLKTKSATRKLPLYALLTDEEQERLKKWCKSRLAEEQKTAFSKFLFSLPESGYQFVPQDGLFGLWCLTLTYKFKYGGQTSW